MKSKRLFIVSFLILAFLTIGIVSASDSCDNLTADNACEEVLDTDLSDEIVSVEDESQEAVGDDAGNDEIVGEIADEGDIIGDAPKDVQTKAECDGYISTDAYGDVYYKDKSTKIAYMEDMPKNAKGKLVLYEKNKVIASKNLSNGKATIKLSDLNIQPSSKEHNLVAKYEGDDYKIDDYDIDFKVIYYTLKGTQLYAGGTGKFTITLPADATGKVSMSGTKSGSAKISNGKAVITISNMKMGSYSLHFSYSNSKYGFSDDLYFSVYPKTFSTPSKVVAGKNNYFTIGFPKSSSGKVTVKVYNVKTDKSTTYKKSYKNGKASFPASKLAAGHYYLMDFSISDSKYGKLRFTETSQFIAEGLFSDFKVVYPKLTLKKVKIKKSAKKITLSASLGKVNKKYLKGKKIVFKFNGKKYTAKTNSKGIAKYTIKKSVIKKLKAGKKVTYSATYCKKTVKKSAKVKK